jgi:hypothetical protein
MTPISLDALQYLGGGKMTSRQLLRQLGAVSGTTVGRG